MTSSAAGGKLSYPPPLCGSSGRAGLGASPGGASLRSTGRVRFMPDGPPGVDLTTASGSPYRVTDELSSQCGESPLMTSEDIHACMPGPGSSLTAPSSILRVRCLRGGGGQVPHQHFQSSGVDDLPPPAAVTTSVISSPQTQLGSKYN